VPIKPRRDWQARVEQQGLVWHTPFGEPYWREDAYYEFHEDEIAAVKAATVSCYKMLLEAGDRIIRDDLYDRFGIPDWCRPLIAESWEREPPALNFGRFDFGYDNVSPPKLFEFNCDTPTSLVEASVVQWDWKVSLLPRHRQYNEIHECLIEKWKDIAPYLKDGPVYFTCAVDALAEDIMTVSYLRDTATQAGLGTDTILVRDIGWDRARKRFVDLHDREIATLFKLYPWEWLAREPFGRNIPLAPTLWIEPIWKMLWSNKAVLAILWEMFPGHPNLLPASFERPKEDCVAKPALGREGRGVRILKAGTDDPGVAEDLGTTIYQDYHALPQFDGRHPVLGAWIVDGYPAGMGVREGDAITANNSCFVPHVLERRGWF